ncbi:aldose epimerase family protein [uncultured Subdoligranulum sp.]|uniref:aldose epimerase family protein n=1 Tax=uncultured Subdoligranulum sp. TaxID=512298 RepID=UPI0032099857
MSVSITDFGKTAAGENVRLVVLKNDQLEVHLLTYAALIHKILVPDRNGNPVDVVLGYPTVPDYERNTDYMGRAIGRFANRIGGAQFPLYEETVHVTANENGNCLHSGLHGFGATLFDVEPTAGENDSVTMTASSPDGTDGFPGNVELEIQYKLVKSGLMIHYTATTDAPTVCSLTNHSYFNLNGHASGTALGHRVSVDADAYLETDDGSIPTGRRIPVAGTPMDFTEEKTLGLDIGADYPALNQGGGYDHCYIIRDTGLRHAAWVTGPQTGIRMEVLTTLPGMQLYSANSLAPGTDCKDGAHYQKRDAVCLETEEFPDAPNHPDFPDTTVLPDTPYSSTTIYRFDLAPQ